MSILNKFSLNNKIALVTGASYGIGFEIAKSLAGAGAKIVFNDVVPENLQKGLEAYKEAGIDAHGYLFDITDEAAVEKSIAQIEKEHGVIDILVNNAGIGKIINICSMMSELGRETVVGYASAKGGLKMLTKNICSEFGHANIQCNGIGPGYIATPQTAPLREKQADGSRHPFDQFIIAKTPAGRWGTPDDLAGAAVFLASEASNFVNGHILYVDGGILAYIGKQP